MVETGVLGERVIDALVASGAVTAERLAAAEEAACNVGRSPGRVLLDEGAVTSDVIASALEDTLGVPRVDLSSYAPDAAALALVSAETATARSVLPLFEIDSMLTVAIGDATDVFEIDALADELGMEVEIVLVEPASLRQALIAHYGPAAEPLSEPAAPTSASPASTAEAPESASRHASESDGETAGQEIPAPEAITAVCAGEIDLDVLAVADAGKVAVLVSDILEHAVGKRASGVHLLPYKDDFFLAYRIGGRLENIASAPLSLQAALVDGFKAYVRLANLPGTSPALGRIHSRVCDQELVLTLSAVPTVSGQRVVISLGADRGLPRDLSALGMPEAERRALQAMVERGRGMLLVCGPVAGGRSATYYALLAHAALAGRTVYSVERAVEYEIPAVAQVLVNPGSPVGSSSYFAAGMLQDTDVMAIDSMHSVDDIHGAVEAAGMGKLVIATFSGGGIVAGVRRMLDLGAEPTSLAAALTFAVGQRLVRTNCPKCVQEEQTPIAGRIPGASPATVSYASAGCASCGTSGFGGLTGLFEVLPFAESVRAAIATNAGAGDIESRAIAAGMRPMVAEGLAKVEQGIVSAEELNRVLRFAE
jgi:type II secretory ATPase GspE/PulE/Tfp pilus assembly ATPase PilB-like protein